MSGIVRTAVILITADDLRTVRASPDYAARPDHVEAEAIKAAFRARRAERRPFFLTGEELNQVFQWKLRGAHEQQAAADAEPPLTRAESDPARDQREATAHEGSEEQAPEVGRGLDPTVERIASDKRQSSQQEGGTSRRDDPARCLHARVVAQDSSSDHRATDDEADRAEEPCHPRTHAIGCGRGRLEPGLRHHLFFATWI